jgi:hypothetical protein
VARRITALSLAREAILGVAERNGARRACID